jgi:hypothetical protein
MWLLIEPHDGADRARVAGKPPLPQLVTEDRHVRGTRPIFGLQEGTAGDRRDAQRRKDRVCDPLRLDSLGRAGAGQHEGGAFVARHRRKGAGAIPVVQELGGRRAQQPLTHERELLAQRDETIRVGIGRSAQEHGMNHAEHGRADRDAEREHQDRNNGVGTASRECAEGVADILE